MGLTPLWRLRAADGDGAVDAANIAASAPAVVDNPKRESADGRIAAPREPLMPVAATARVNDSPATVSPVAGGAPQIAALDWPALEETILACRACPLCERRTQAVPGVGDRGARWMFVGEGPGAEEDRRGEPFVGQAGKLLDNMLAALGLKRGEDVYIANAVKCRPPHNRTPEAAEIAACLPYLDRQIKLVRPRLLIALGRPAAQALLGREISIAAARGKRFEHAGVAVTVTYHPAYLLRNPLDKGKAWEDLCFARRLMAEGN
ncbi:MAG: uracil-DNA glycosylase [Azoarcus sp.]|jgi:DNA polymerase|nr:uracil-DNA glycosylase [Azoarcus sp.]